MLAMYVGDELRSVPLDCTILWCSAVIAILLEFLLTRAFTTVLFIS